jgi:cytoskeletal protein RodZ
MIFEEKLMRNVRIGTIRGAILMAMLIWGGVVSTQAGQAPAADKAKSNPVEHAIVGTVESVDNAAKTVSIKTADGTVKVVKVSEKTTVEGMKAGANYTALGAEKGAHIVVKYSGDGADATVTGIKYLGKGTVRVSEGTVTKVDDAAKTVTVKTASGAEEVYSWSEKGTVETGKGIAKGTTQGAKVSVYYTEEGGKKVAHFFKHL